MSKQVFSFPGFNVTGNADTDRFKVDIGTLAFKGDEFVLHMMLSTNAPSHAVHSVAGVECAGKKVWVHDRTKDAGTYTRLAFVDDEPVIAYVDQKSGNVVRTHPFIRFSRKLPLTVAMQVAYKRGAADYLEAKAEFTQAEEAFRQVDPAEQKWAAEAKAKREAEQAAREAEREAKRKEREERRKAVRALVAGREEVLVRTANGLKRGQPVLQEEIPQLEPKQFYVLVGKIDQDGVPYNPVKAFKAIAVKGKGIIMADGGHEATDFFVENLVTPKPTGSKNFELSGEVFEVPIYADMAAIETLVQLGINGVEFAAFPQGNTQFQVFILDGTEGATEAVSTGLLKPYTGQQSQVA